MDRIFEGMVFLLVGKMEQSQIEKDATERGAQISKSLNKKTTHVLTTRNTMQHQVKKLDKAIAKRLPMIDINWFKECLDANCWIPFDKYIIVPESLPGKRLRDDESGTHSSCASPAASPMSEDRMDVPFLHESSPEVHPVANPCLRSAMSPTRPNVTPLEADMGFEDLRPWGSHEQWGLRNPSHREALKDHQNALVGSSSNMTNTQRTTEVPSPGRHLPLLHIPHSNAGRFQHPTATSQPQPSSPPRKKVKNIPPITKPAAPPPPPTQPPSSTALRNGTAIVTAAPIPTSTLRDGPRFQSGGSLYRRPVGTKELDHKADIPDCTDRKAIDGISNARPPPPPSRNPQPPTNRPFMPPTEQPKEEKDAAMLTDTEVRLQKPVRPLQYMDANRFHGPPPRSGPCSPSKAPARPIHCRSDQAITKTEYNTLGNIRSLPIFPQKPLKTKDEDPKPIVIGYPLVARHGRTAPPSSCVLESSPKRLFSRRSSSGESGLRSDHSPNSRARPPWNSDTNMIPSPNDSPTFGTSSDGSHGNSPVPRPRKAPRRPLWEPRNRVPTRDVPTRGIQRQRHSPIKRPVPQTSTAGGPRRLPARPQTGPQHRISQGTVKPATGARPMPSGPTKNKEKETGDEDEHPLAPKVKNHRAIKGKVDEAMWRQILREIVDTSKVVKWDDISGLENAKKILYESVIFPSKRPDLFTGLRQPPKGLLLFGPPGNGKTMLAKAVASQCNSTFFNISASSLTSKWVGEGEKLMRALFAVARALQPSVIFIDEVDSLLTSRNANDHEASRRLKTEYLVQMDGVGTDDKDRILVLAATNRPNELDDAALRRFTKRVYLPLPDGRTRRTMAQTLLKNERYSFSDEDWLTFVEKTEGYSGSDLASLCKDFAMEPLRDLGDRAMEVSAEEIRPINIQDFLTGIKNIRPSVARDQMAKMEQWNANFGSSA